jgi:hypothetical protein
MAFDLIREIHEGDWTDNIGVTEGSRTFIVHGTANEQADDVLSAAGIPLTNDSHPANAFALCRRRVANRMGQQMKGLWRVECFYSNAPLTREQEERILIQNPTLRPAVVDTGVVRDEVPCDIDRNGQSYKNSAGDPFDPHPSKFRSRLQINVRKNFASIPDWYWGLGDTINYHALAIGHGINKTCRDSTLMFVPAGTSEQKEDNGISYVEVRFTLDFRESFRILGYDELIIARDERRLGTEEEPTWVPVPSDWVGDRISIIGQGGAVIRRRTGWDREILDAGYYYNLAPDDPGFGVLLETRQRFTDLNGSFATSPQYLDGEEGQKTEYAHYLQFGDYLYGDFRVLSGVVA